MGTLAGQSLGINIQSSGTNECNHRPTDCWQHLWYDRKTKNKGKVWSKIQLKYPFWGTQILNNYTATLDNGSQPQFPKINWICTATWAYSVCTDQLITSWSIGRGQMLTRQVVVRWSWSDADRQVVVRWSWSDADRQVVVRWSWSDADMPFATATLTILIDVTQMRSAIGSGGWCNLTPSSGVGKDNFLPVFFDSVSDCFSKPTCLCCLYRPPASQHYWLGRWARSVRCSLCIIHVIHLGKNLQILTNFITDMNL